LYLQELEVQEESQAQQIQENTYVERDRSVTGWKGYRAKWGGVGGVGWVALALKRPVIRSVFKGQSSNGHQHRCWKVQQQTAWGGDDRRTGGEKQTTITQEAISPNGPSTYCSQPHCLL
jgi:hypothetical protein